VDFGAEGVAVTAEQGKEQEQAQEQESAEDLTVPAEAAEEVVGGWRPDGSGGGNVRP
jgi:hypothetical protein